MSDTTQPTTPPPPAAPATSTRGLIRTPAPSALESARMSPDERAAIDTRRAGEYADSYVPQNPAARTADQPAADTTTTTQPGDPPIDTTKHKFGDLELTAKEIQDLAAFKAETDSRAATLPATPTDYKLELPKDFVLPPGIEGEWKFDETDPMLQQAREMAHSLKLSQGDFSKLLSLHAASRLADDVKIANAARAEREKLGATGPARVDSISLALRAKLGDDLARPLLATMVTAKHIAAYEQLVFGKASPGFSPQHREPASDGRVSEAEYNSWTPRQQMAYAQQFPQPGQR